MRCLQGSRIALPRAPTPPAAPVTTIVEVPPEGARPISPRILEVGKCTRQERGSFRASVLRQPAINGEDLKGRSPQVTVTWARQENRALPAPPALFRVTGVGGMRPSPSDDGQAGTGKGDGHGRSTSRVLGENGKAPLVGAPTQCVWLCAGVG
jgi:hypothetical protein